VLKQLGAEYIFRILQVKKIPFTTYDLASDEEAKKLWRRKAPQGEHVGPYVVEGPPKLMHF
jgi:hypothetical protein